MPKTSFSFTSGQKVRIRVKQRPRIRGPVIDNVISERLGRFMLEENKKRIQSGMTDKDIKAPPLKKGYAIFKTRKTRRAAKRDMTLTGDTMNNFTLRKATDTQIVAGLTIEKYRQRMRRWGSIIDTPGLGFNIFGFSGKETVNIYKTARELVGERFRRLISLVRT